MLIKNDPAHSKNQVQQQQIKYGVQFQGYQSKHLSFKINNIKQNFLALPSVLQYKKISCICGKNPSKSFNSVDTSNRKATLFYFNWTKIIQDSNILKIPQSFEILFLKNHVQGNSPYIQILD